MKFVSFAVSVATANVAATLVVALKAAGHASFIVGSVAVVCFALSNIITIIEFQLNIIIMNNFIGFNFVWYTEIMYISDGTI